MVRSGNKAKKPNRLIHEKSPYLLQHAYNPVDWYPWGSEAFEKARQENRPVFLSIGYSTCHWCHVMEKESFEDPEVAALMNDVFVPVKVDREERPDIDTIYMQVCQMITGSGGWPLTVIMTPDKKPFFAGTYFPKESRFGRLGMLELIPRLSKLWNENPSMAFELSDKIVSMLIQESEQVPSAFLDAAVLDAAFEQMRGSFDKEYGGFGRAPKFPLPSRLFFLIRYWKRTGREDALSMVERTLTAMHNGGIYDHVGYGFHRYSTDEIWLVPHFEKMLYDQALLAVAYLEAFQVTRKHEFRTVAEEILDYVMREMTSPEGGFYSAEDADSEGEEGKFYVWTQEEIFNVLNPEEAAQIIKMSDIQSDGNFIDQLTGAKNGTNIIHLHRTFVEASSDENQPFNQCGFPEEALRKLYETRKKRVRPHRDDKVLTDWNGLMISAFARAGKVFRYERYISTARKAVDFILKNMTDADGKLLHRYRDKEAAISGLLDDYAFFVMGLIDLYEATFDLHYLRSALQLNTDMLRYFLDEKDGGLFMTVDGAETVLLRPKEGTDGVVPSGNSVAFMNLLRLGRLTAAPVLEEKASQISRYFAKDVSESPLAFTCFLCALDFSIGPVHEVVVTGKTGSQDTDRMVQALHQEFLPRTVVLFRPDDEETPGIFDIAPFTRSQRAVDGAATAYICQNYACSLPTTDIDAMLKMLSIQQP